MTVMSRVAPMMTSAASPSSNGPGPLFRLGNRPALPADRAGVALELLVQYRVVGVRSVAGASRDAPGHDLGRNVEPEALENRAARHGFGRRPLLGLQEHRIEHHR